MLNQIKLLLSFALIVLLNNHAYSKEALNLTPEEQKIFESIKSNDSRLTMVTTKDNKTSPSRFNNRLEVFPDDNRIVRLKMSVNDVTGVKFCYKSPVMVEFGETIRTKIERVQISNNKLVEATMLKGNRSIMVALKESISKISPDNDEGTWETTVYVERASDKEDYVLKFFAEKCPTNSKKMPYPAKIIIEDREGLRDTDSRILLPTDYITELTMNLPRDNRKNHFKVNGFSTKPNSLWHSLSISLGFKDIPLHLRKKGRSLYVKKPKFIILDSNKQFELKNHSEFLKYPSMRETKEEEVATSRYNLMVQLTKKYIYEKKYIYVIVLFEDEKYHQFIKIPIYKLFQKEMSRKVKGQ